MSREIEIKTERVAELLSRERLGGVLMNGQHNFAWITAGGNNGVDISRENGVASIFVRADGKLFLLANNIEMKRIRSEQLATTDIEEIEYSWQDEKDDPNILIEKSKNLSNLEIATDIPLHRETRPIDGLLSACRFSLTSDEVVRYRKLGNDAGFAIQQVLRSIVPGETEIKIAAKLRGDLAALDIQSVVTLAAADERIGGYRHPVPTENRWKKTLLLVTCAKRHGLIVSLSRMVHFGETPNELADRTEAAAYVNARLLSATRPGATGDELYRTAAAAYAERGFAGEIDKHHQGGAAGYRTREWVAHPKSREAVMPQQAFAWNPSITGTKVEETAVVTDSGVEIITCSPEFPVISHMIEGREYHSPGVLSIH